MKIAFDLHGVIDTHPEIIYPMMFFTKTIGHDICIVSGPSAELIKNKLTKINFYKTFSFITIYSVVDFLQESGVETWKDKNGDVWADDQNWWDAKAKICKYHDIDYIIDDSEKYKSAFELTSCGFIHIDELI